jgi:hypothetical protein
VGNLGVCVVLKITVTALTVLVSAMAYAEAPVRHPGQTALLAPPPGTVSGDPDRPRRLSLTDVAVVVAVIAASRAAYLNMGKPCACPDNVAANGSRCGLRSAHSKPGGFKPLCYPTDITAGIIASWRATGTIPSL